MSTKKAITAGAALAAAGFIGAGIAQAAPLDAFILGGPRTITADVIGAGVYHHCDLHVDTTPAATKPSADFSTPNGRAPFRMQTTQSPGTYYVDVICYTSSGHDDPKPVKRNVVVRVF